MKVTKVLIAFGILSTGNLVSCLHCWHCISEDCSIDPGKNLRAIEKHCSQGQVCQKVFYKRLEGSVLDISTVRGCSHDCKTRDDFINNCSQYLLTSRGCVRKDCCRDQDFCNAAPLHLNIHSSCIHVYCFFVMLFKRL